MRSSCRCGKICDIRDVFTVYCVKTKERQAKNANPTQWSHMNQTQECTFGSPVLSVLNLQ